MNKEITIYDIAREAGVSPSTVSRVMTNRARVSPSKRKAVQDVIDKYQFRPNMMARRLSDTRSNVLGILVADIRNPYYATVVVECELAAGRRGYSVMVCNALGNPSLEESNLTLLYNHRVDAIIQLGCRADDAVSDPAYVEHVNSIANITPFISTGKLDGVHGYCLHIDDASAIDAIMEYLLSMGHRRIAFAGGFLSVESTRKKVERFIYSLGTNQLDFDSSLLVESEYSVDAGRCCAEKLLGLPSPPSAIVAVNDIVALGLMDAAMQRNIHVPQDLSLVGFDNTYLAKVVTPKLTTVDYNYPLLGEKLVDTALKVLNGEAVPEDQTITPALIIRDSCAFPRAK
ncbi:MAG: LacI family DNA-binding transcriptional regulator [Candidatus Limiplasma sp.]|nr:LacI family DNA-binding transcriptional regulator [Candidatus Limiplasma sp.]